MNDDDDPESICFVGRTDSAPEIDFSKDIYMVEFFFSSNVLGVSVNASSERQAIAEAILRAKDSGVNPITIDKCSVTKMELIDGGENERA